MQKRIEAEKYCRKSSVVYSTNEYMAKGLLKNKLYKKMDKM